MPGGIPILAVTGYDPPWTLFGGCGKVTCYAVALYAKAALGLAIPNLATMENKATTIWGGVRLDPNGRDWKGFAHCSKPWLPVGNIEVVAGLRFAVVFGIDHPHKFKQLQYNNKQSGMRWVRSQQK